MESNERKLFLGLCLARTLVIAAVKGGQQIQRDAAAKRKWNEAEADNTFRVHGLVTKYFDASMRDPDLKARLDKLVADYDSMFKDSPAR